MHKRRNVSSYQQTMPEPSSADPWSALVNQLGVEPAAQPEITPAAAPVEPSTPQAPPPKAAAPKKPRPAANWGNIAGQLGVDVPPEPEPASGPPTTAAGPPQVESLVRGTADRDAGRSDRPRPQRRDAEESRAGGERPARGEGERGGRPYGRERGHGRNQQSREQTGQEQRGRHEQGRGRGDARGRGRDDRSGGRPRRDDRGRGGRERSRPARGSRDDDRRETREDRGQQRDYGDRYRSDREELETQRSGYDEHRSSPMAEEHAAPFDVPPMELDDSVIEARDITPEFAEAPSDDDFGDADSNDLQDSVHDLGVAEGTVPSRRRRRRRGRRGVHREDAFLGIDRLATEDIVGRPPAAAEERREDSVEDREEISLGEEIRSIEIGGDEDDDESAPVSEADKERKRRRRRRRGRGSKERSADKGRVDVSTDETDEDTEAFGRDRDERPDAREMRQRDKADADDDELDEPDDNGRPSKNLHREVTPWAEAIGFIVSTNMEARSRSPGRWGKNDRRS